MHDMVAYLDRELTSNYDLRVYKLLLHVLR